MAMKPRTWSASQPSLHSCMAMLPPVLLDAYRASSIAMSASPAVGRMFTLLPM